MSTLSTAQREVLSRLQQPRWFLKAQVFMQDEHDPGITRWYFYRRTWTVENMGRVNSAATVAVLRRRGLIQPEEMSGRKRWMISDYGRRIMQREYQARVAAEGPE